MKLEMRKLWRTGCVLSLSLLLGANAGCRSLSPAEQRAADERTCLGYGFEPNTPALERCLKNLR